MDEGVVSLEHSDPSKNKYIKLEHFDTIRGHENFENDGRGVYDNEESLAPLPDNWSKTCKIGHEDSNVERKNTELAEGELNGCYGEKLDSCENWIFGRKSGDIKARMCTSLENNVESHEVSDDIVSVKVERYCENDVSNGDNETSGHIDQPLDLRLPMKRTAKLTASILDKSCQRRKEKRHRKMLKKDSKDSCKNLSNSLQSLEKFGNEFDFNTTLSHLGYDHTRLMQTVKELTAPTMHMNSDLKPLKIPVVLNAALSSTFRNIRSMVEKPLDRSSNLNCSDSEFNDRTNGSFHRGGRSNGNADGIFRQFGGIHRCTCEMQFNTLQELSVHAKKTGHRPISRRVSDYPKLVRGQDMWLNRGLEQTKRILRCMQCGQSFNSLPELTTHMMETQHYEKIVNAEQSMKRTHRCSVYCEHDGECVFKCKVCHEHFRNMDSLAGHMIDSGHHKQLPTMSTSSSSYKLSDQNRRNCHRSDRSPGRGKQKRRIGYDPDRVKTNVERKNLMSSVSLSANSPSFVVTDKQAMSGKGGAVVNERTGNDGDTDTSSAEDFNDRRITCENCQDKIQMSGFVEHVRLCLRIKNETAIRVKVKRENTYEFNCHETTVCSASSSIVSNNDKFSVHLPKMEVGSAELASFKPGLHDERHSHVHGAGERSSMDIIDPHSLPEETYKGALQAMESLINNSFSGKTNHAPKLDLKSLEESALTTYQSLATDDSYESTSANGLLESMSQISDRILDVVYKKRGCENAKRVCNEREERYAENFAVKDGGVKMETGSLSGYSDSDCSGNRNDDDAGSKYLTEEELEKLNENEKPMASSALDSLSSFVYGQKLTSEHPLEKLEKLKMYEKYGVRTDIAKTESTYVEKYEKKMELFPMTSSSSSAMMNTSCSSSQRSASRDASVKARNPDSPKANADNPKRVSPHRNGRVLNEIPLYCPLCKVPFSTQNELTMHFIQTRCFDTHRLADLAAYKSLVNAARESYAFAPFVYLPLDHTSLFTKFNEAFK